MENEKKGFWTRAGIYLGLIEEGVSEKRSDTVIYGPASAPSGRSSRSTVVTAGDAMNLVAVYRAVSILSTAIKQLPMSVYRQGVEIDTPSLVKAPSLTVNRTTFIEQTVMSLAVNGNAYWRLQKSGPTGAVQGIEVLNPHMVTIDHDPATGKVVKYSYGDKEFKPWQVKHLSLLKVPGSPYGLGPIQAAQSTLLGARDVRDYSANWFRQGAVPNGILKTDQVITPEQADAYKSRFMETQSDGRGPAVLGQGVNYQPIYLSPSDAQFLETQEFTKTEIATLFGIPATYMLADGGNSMTYQNVQQADLSFLKYTLQQYITEIEQAFSDLIPRGQEARFVVEGFLRADRETRFEGYKTAIETGFLTINEVRAIEGYRPLTPEELDANKPKPPVAPEPVDPQEGGSQ